MDYREAANFLFDLRRFRMKPGTDSTERLLSRVGDPHAGGTFVQVAGSNGKGSTARMTASILREAGLDVGLFTSPHLEDVRERVQVNGRPVPKGAVSEYVAAIESHVLDRAADGDPPTFFEVLTGLALWHFDREDVDVGVLEVGIGGRHDSTSVVEPAASAVTSVSLEHTAVLGDTVAEIARDMAQVAPASGPLVTATDGDALDALRSVTEELCLVGGADADVTVGYDGLTDRYEGAVSVDDGDVAVETDLPLAGAHQATNAGIAVTLARQVAAPAEAAIATGLAKATWPGRFEILGHDPLVVLDGAHNPDACAALADTVAEIDCDALSVVFGAMHDKDLAGMASALPAPDRVYACEPALDRAEDAAVLERVFERRDTPVRTVDAVETAVYRAIESAGSDDCVLVTGSLYTVREARRRWTRLQRPRQHADLDAAAATIERAHVAEEGARRTRGNGVHRTISTRLQPRQARIVKEELLALGGDCAVSGIQDSTEPVEVVLMGTHTQLRRLATALEDQPYALSLVAEELRDTISSAATTEPESEYPWEDRTAVMGILNVTPDSFHDGGEYNAVDDAVERARAMVEAGADVVDVGGESTRPGADPVPTATERERVCPVVRELADLDALVSVDTRKASVAAAALDAGADVLNDVSGLEDPEMAHVAAAHDAPLVLMHSVETPVDPDRSVAYDDVVTEVIADLRERVLRAERAGLDRERVLVDPGLGFGKTAEESFALLDRLEEFDALGCPVLVGHSHKSMFEAIGEQAGDCLEATIAGTAIAADRGADVVRVHDVRENVAAVRAVERAADVE